MLEKINYKGWQNCYRLNNESVDLIMTTDVGPRIIRYGFVGQANEFKEYPHMMGKTGGDEWRIYGGHRFWHAPENIPRTYYPDNEPLKIEEHSGFIRLIQNTEPTTGLQKEIDISLDKEGSGVTVTHRLRNHNLWALELAPWALSVMDVGGKAIIPLPPRGLHEENPLPTSSLSLWAYTNLADPRWALGQKYIMLQQSPTAKSPQKIGASVPSGWVGYANNNHLFVVKFQHQASAIYPDIGSVVETFTNSDMLEIETLGPLTNLQPQAAVEHTEHWRLFDNVPMPQNEADIETHILPLIQS